MNLSVCPHDIVKQMSGWLTFATYLQRALGEPVQLKTVTDFASFYESSLPEAELAFVNPMDAWRLVRQDGFTPLFRTEAYDEVVFITAAERQAAGLAALAGQPIAAVDRQFATYLGIYLLQEQGIQAGEIAFKESWLQAIRSVTRGETPFGMLYRDFYLGLSNLSRSQFRVLYESQTRYATHMLLLHPALAEWRAKIEAALASMHTDSEGAAILKELGLGRWVPGGDLGMIEQVLTSAGQGA